MSDNAVIPRHLRVLAETWAELVERLALEIVPVMPTLSVQIGRTDVERFKLLAIQETEALTAWITRAREWCNGPLAAALANAEIADRDMRRIAGRLSHFADELVERRQGLRVAANDPAMRAAAPRLDAVHLSLLSQTNDFVAGVVHALGPAALQHPNGKRRGDTIELSFTFRPNVDQTLGRFSAWMRHAQAELESGAPAPTNVGEQVAAYPPRVGARKYDWIALVVVAAAAIPFFLFPVQASLMIFVVWLVIFIFRHPLLALLAFLFGIS